MSKAADIAKVSAKGSFNLLWGLVISQVISAVGLIIIGNLLGAGNYGIYTIVLSAPNLIMLFRDWGVNSAMVRFTAQSKAENRLPEIRSIFASGLIFEIALGLVLTIISFALSGVLATTFNRPEIAPLIQIISFSIFAGGLINAATAAFTGVEEMQLNSIMLICQSIIKILVTIGLVVSLLSVGLQTTGAVIGSTIGTLIGGLIGVLLMWTIYRKMPKPVKIRQEIVFYIKELFKYGMPLSISAIIAGFLAAFYTFLLPIYLPSTENALIGSYGIAQNFVVLIGFFATPITTMLFPAFSKLDHKKDKETLKNVFQSSIKYASLLVVPAAALVMCLSEPAVTTLFGETYASAPLFLALLAFQYLYTALGNLSMGNLLNSQGQTTYVLKLTLLTAAIGFPLGFVLIMQYGVLGLLAATLTSAIPSLFTGLRWIKKHYELSVDWRSSAKILLSAAITSAVTYLIVYVLNTLNFPSWTQLVVGVIIFFIVFLASVLLTRAITYLDIHNLRGMTSDIGFVGQLVHFVFDLLEKIMKKLRL